MINGGGKRRDGTTIWQARMADPLRPGGTAKLERSFRTKRDAQDWLATQRASVLRGSYVDARQGDRPFSAGKIFDRSDFARTAGSMICR